jgi:hypothetical protein
MQGREQGQTPAQIRAAVEARHGSDHGMAIPRPPGP